MGKENPTVVFPVKKKAEIQALDIPVPGEGEVLIKTSRTMISIGTEMTAFTGDFPAGTNWEKFFSCPYYPGYNNIGTVVDTGPGVDKSAIGRRVASNGRHAAYVKALYREKLPSPEESGSMQAKGRGGCYLVPDVVSDDHAVFFTIPQIVMNGIRASKVQWGECAAVFGLGLLGQFAVRFCRLCGAAPVFGVDVSGKRLALLPDDPAVIPVNPKKEDTPEFVKKHNHGRQADLVFEITGCAALMEGELKCLREKGRLVLLSSPRDKVVFDFQDNCAWPSQSIIGCHNFSHPTFPQADNPWVMDRHKELFFDLAARGELDLDRLISRNVKYTEAPGVYQDLLADRSSDMGIIFTWD
jgi:threonine dehydrogenase-like Zn-dependent dehydrogenase